MYTFFYHIQLYSFLPVLFCLFFLPLLHPFLFIHPIFSCSPFTFPLSFSSPHSPIPHSIPVRSASPTSPPLPRLIPFLLPVYSYSSHHITTISSSSPQFIQP